MTKRVLFAAWGNGFSRLGGTGHGATAVTRERCASTPRWLGDGAPLGSRASYSQSMRGTSTWMSAEASFSLAIPHRAEARPERSRRAALRIAADCAPGAGAFMAEVEEVAVRKGSEQIACLARI